MKLRTTLRCWKRWLAAGSREASLLVTGGKGATSCESKVLNFSDLPLHPALKLALRKLPFDALTAVQRLAIPTILGGNDAMLCSETGSGKTLAFVVPLLNSLLKSELKEGKRKHRQQPFGIVLSPSLQLSAQHNGLVSQLLEDAPYNSDMLHARIFPKQHADILATHPDAAMKAFEKNALRFGSCRFVVIDEADKFIHQDLTESLRKFLNPTFSGLPPKSERRTVICGATLSTLAQEIYSPFLQSDCVKIVRDSRQAPPAPTAICQDFLWCPERGLSGERLELLCLSLNKVGVAKVIVFCSSSLVKRLTAFLNNKGFRAVPLSRQLGHQQNSASLRHFSQDRANILVASDLGSRGLDLPDVNFIINYELPNNLEAYIHRIGRAGRMGRAALAISMFGIEDRGIARELINFLDSCGDPVPDFLFKESGLFGHDHDYKFES